MGSVSHYLVQKSSVPVMVRSNADPRQPSVLTMIPSSFPDGIDHFQGCTSPSPSAADRAQSPVATQQGTTYATGPGSDRKGESCSYCGDDDPNQGGGKGGKGKGQGRSRGSFSPVKLVSLDRSVTVFWAIFRARRSTEHGRLLRFCLLFVLSLFRTPYRNASEWITST